MIVVVVGYQNQIVPYARRFQSDVFRKRVYQNAPLFAFYTETAVTEPRNSHLLLDNYT